MPVSLRLDLSFIYWSSSSLIYEFCLCFDKVLDSSMSIIFFFWDPGFNGFLWDFGFITFDLLLWLSYFIFYMSSCRFYWWFSVGASLCLLVLWNLVDPINRFEFCKIGWRSLSNLTFDLGLKWLRCAPNIFWIYFLVCFELDIIWFDCCILESLILIL